MEHKKIKAARKACRERNIKYKIKGNDAALFVYDKTIKKYMQVCFSLYNLTETQIVDMIEKLSC